MKRLILSLLLIISVLSCSREEVGRVISVTQSEYFPDELFGDGLAFRITSYSENTAQVSGTDVEPDRENYAGGLVIPTEIEYEGTRYRVTSIGAQAFDGCRKMTSIAIPASVTSIEWFAFNDCESLSSALNLESVESIGACAFFGCSSLPSVTLGKSVTRIGSRAFSGCSGLRSVRIPDSVTSVEEGAFSYCSGLTAVAIGGSVTRIGTEAFAWCGSLISVTIPGSVTAIGKMAFYGCSGLASAYCMAKVPPEMGWDIFRSTAEDLKIYVPAASAMAYKSAGGWSDYADRIVGYDFE